MTGRPSLRTRALVVEEGGFLYDRDALNDELPYWVQVDGRDHLVIPYSYETNDMRYGSATGGFVTGRDFADYLCDAFDQLYEEGATRPAAHDRRPARAHRRAARAARTGSCGSSTTPSRTTACGSRPGARSPSTGAGSSRRR